MSNLKIGPEIYDAFFTINKDIYTQYIYMEKFDQSVYHFIQNINKSR